MSERAYLNNNCFAAMERLQGPINPCFLEELLDVECLEDGFELEEQEGLNFLTPSLENKMPFLQMLQQSVDHSQSFQPSFQNLLRLQNLKKQQQQQEQPWEMMNPFFMSDHQLQPLELESCVTHELYSPVKSESKDLYQKPYSTPPPPPPPCIEAESNQEQLQPNNSEENCCREVVDKESSPLLPKDAVFPKTSPPISRERRKRKRAKVTKNKEEVESQRMTHIAVERNRRKQMNDYLNSLRSLMPPTYVQRGDQASILGGAIDFVKELEQLMQSLEARKRMRTSSNEETKENNNSTSSCSLSGISSNSLYTSPSQDGEEKLKTERSSESVKVEVTVIQNHVNLKIQCLRSHGQLLKAIVSLEELRLTVLHLNITSSQDLIYYTFNLKMEDDCRVNSADDIAAVANEMFSNINMNGGTGS